MSVDVALCRLAARGTPGIEETRSRQLATDPASPDGAQPHRGSERVPRGPAIPGAPPRASRARALDRLRRLLASDLREAFVEPARVRLFRLGERLEPLRELGEAFLPRGLGHARVHLGVLVRLAGDRGPEVLLGLADRLVRDRIADLFQEVEVPEGVAGLRVRRVLEEARHVGGPFAVGDAREVEGAPGRLRLAGERLLQVRVTLGAREALAS